MPNSFRGVSAEEVLKMFEKIASRNDVAGFMSEPVWTNAGVFVPPPDFYPKIEKICRRYGLLLIMDEVATGFGRCGKLFASELWDLKPDILCLGKGLTGGYGTLGATLVTEEIFERSQNIPHYSTFGWNLLDLAAASANIDVILKENLVANVQRLHSYFLTELKQFEKLEFVGEVRGIGFLFGLEIIKDKKSKQPDAKKAMMIQEACEKKGLIIETAYHNLFISPPLTLTKEIIKEGIKILKSVLF